MKLLQPLWTADMHMQKTEFSGEIVTAMEDLKKAGALKKWGKGLEGLERRNVFM